MCIFHYRWNTFYLLQITFIFDKCHRSRVVVTLFKYECNAKDLTDNSCKGMEFPNHWIAGRSFRTQFLMSGLPFVSAGQHVMHQVMTCSITIGMLDASRIEFVLSATVRFCFQLSKWRVIARIFCGLFGMIFSGKHKRIRNMYIWNQPLASKTYGGNMPYIVISIVLPVAGPRLLRDRISVGTGMSKPCPK